MRTATIKRKTNETDVEVKLDLDGSGRADVKTDCGFMKHMLELFARHGGFDIAVTATGDSEVDFHHTVEDTGITLGKAFSAALGDKRGITRYGFTAMPMDLTLVLAAADLSGRTALNYNLKIPAEKIGDFDTELAREFWAGFSRECAGAYHFVQLSGDDSHHIIEAAFKGMARALKAAVAIDPDRADEIPSTKGVL